MDCSSQPRRRRDLVVRNCAAGSATRQRCADAGDMAAEAVARAWAVAVGQQAVRRLGVHSGHAGTRGCQWARGGLAAARRPVRHLARFTLC